MVEHVPLYPLAPLLFLVSAVLFACSMARHLRVWAYAKPAPTVSDEPGRLSSLIKYSIVQVRMFRDLDAGIMHATIFWGFVILTVGTADRVTFGIIHTILAGILDGWLWRLYLLAANLFVLGVLVMVGYALFRRLVWRYPRRMTLSRDALVILLLIGGVVLSEWLAEGFRIAAFGDPDAAWAVAGLPAIPAADGDLRPVGTAGGLRPLLLGERRAGQLLPGLPAALQAPAHRHGILQRRAAQDAAARRAAGNGSRGAGRPIRRQDHRGPVLEGPARRLHLHRMRPLPGGLSSMGHGQAAQSQDDDHGHPRDGGRVGGGRAADPVDQAVVRAGHGRSAQPRSRAPVVDNAIPYDAVWDCVTCGACVEACPVHDRARRQDRWPAPQPRAGGGALPGRAHDVVQQHGALPEHLGPAAGVATGLGARACPSTCPPRRRWSTRAAPDAVAELECLYWVGCAASFDDRNRRVARAVVTCLNAAGVKYAVLGQEESCTGDPARRMGNEYVFQMLAMGNVETLNRYKPKTIITACPHCFNTIGNEYGQMGGHYNVVHHSQFLSKLVGDGRLRVDDAARAVHHCPRLVLPGALQRRHRRDARRAQRRAGHRAARDGQQRPSDVLLRRRWRPDVDGGEARHADQRRAHAPGARHRRRGRRHGVSRSAWR